MSNVNAYAGSFVVGQVSEIILNDADEDNDLDQYTDITVLYSPSPGTTIEWHVANVTPIFTPVKDPKPGDPCQVVNTVILQVLPKVLHGPPLGCLGALMSPFSTHRKKRAPLDPPTTGPVTGTLNPPPGGMIRGVALGPKTFTLNDPLIFFGLPA